MLTISDALTAAQTLGYFDEHYSVGDYYTQKPGPVGQWIGAGAADLKLVGDVSREDFAALLKGIDPHSGSVLIPPATHNHQHRAGWDFAFSMPKSASVMALVGGDRRLIEAHQRAVQYALAQLEDYALVRQQHQWVVSGNVVGASFVHFTARPQEGARYGPDPQVHSHNVLLNMSRRAADGLWRSLDPVEMFRAQWYASAIYLSELALAVQRLGYLIEITDSYGNWEIEGFSREQVMAFSQRRAAIEKRLAELGLSGPRAARIVALETREAKGEYDELQLRAEWQHRAAEYRIDVRQQFQQALSRGDVRPDLEAKAALEFAIAHTTNREAVVDRRALEIAALHHGMGKIDLAAVRQEIAVQEIAQRLFLTGHDHRHPQGAFTTDNMLALERENIELMRRRRDTPTTPIANREVVQRWALAKGLSIEQTNAALMALSSNRGILAVEGYAGAAKTTLEGAIREFAQEHGYMIRGFAVTTTAVKALRGVGIQAQTIADLLSKPEPMPTGPELWFVDESSLVSIRQMNQILRLADELGVERVDFVGDQAQHQSIEAGPAMPQLLAEGMPVATLQDIRRQQDPKLREAVKVAHDDGRKAFELLEEQGRITQIADEMERYRRIAADYLAGHQTGQNTLVVSPGNDERRALNIEIRQTLIDHQQIGNTGRRHEILVARDFTPAQVASYHSYQPGDVLHCTGIRDQQRQGIRKDSWLTVEAVNRRCGLLELRTEDGRHIKASPVKWRDGQQTFAEVYTREERTLAVGDRIQFRHPDKKRDIANGQFATITRLTGTDAMLRVEGEKPRELTLQLAAMRRIDYGYTVTSFSSQGSTVDRVIVNEDSTRSPQLVNREQEYVSISRGRIDARIYTDNAEALRHAVARDPKKEIALAAMKRQLEPQQKVTPQFNRAAEQAAGLRW